MMGAVMADPAPRVSLSQQIEAAGEAISALHMQIDSGRARLAGADARWQLERLKAIHQTLKALQIVADIMRDVLRLSPERLASLREMLAQWARADESKGEVP
jgi:hypothetical protein